MMTRWMRRGDSDVTALFLEPFPACQDEKADEVMRAEQDAATWFETWISDNKCK